MSVLAIRAFSGAQMGEWISVQVRRVSAGSNAGLRVRICVVAVGTELEAGGVWGVGIVPTRTGSRTFEGQGVCECGRSACADASWRGSQRISEVCTAVLEAHALPVICEVPTCAGGGAFLGLSVCELIIGGRTEEDASIRVGFCEGDDRVGRTRRDTFEGFSVCIGTTGTARETSPV
jgi:hypothetical protein